MIPERSGLSFLHGGNTAFCTRWPRKNNSAALPVPLKLIKFFGSKTPQKRHLRCSGAAPDCFFPARNRQKVKTRGKPHLCPHFAVLSVFFYFRETPTRRYPELIKFPMPTVRHENKGNSAMSSLKNVLKLLPEFAGRGRAWG